RTTWRSVVDHKGVLVTRLEPEDRIGRHSSGVVICAGRVVAALQVLGLIQGSIWIISAQVIVNKWGVRAGGVRQTSHHNRSKCPKQHCLHHTFPHLMWRWITGLNFTGPVLIAATMLGCAPHRLMPSTDELQAEWPRGQGL